MMDAPSFDWGICPAFDNEFYSRFGISAFEAVSQLRVQKTGTHNQKHRPIY